MQLVHALQLGILRNEEATFVDIVDMESNSKKLSRPLKLFSDETKETGTNISHPSMSGQQYLFCYACSIKCKSEENVFSELQNAFWMIKIGQVLAKYSDFSSANSKGFRVPFTRPFETFSRCNKWKVSRISSVLRSFWRWMLSILALFHCVYLSNRVFSPINVKFLASVSVLSSLHF